MALKSDKYKKPCRTCGHNQYVHSGAEKEGPCNAYTCKRDKKCKAFKK